MNTPKKRPVSLDLAEAITDLFDAQNATVGERYAALEVVRALLPLQDDPRAPSTAQACPAR